jgi:hypothetical protein
MAHEAAPRCRSLAVMVVTVTLLAMGVGATGASADPIEFRFSGVGTGTAGARNFTNASFVITAVGETDDIVTIAGIPGPIYSITAPAVIDITGIGSGPITTPTRVFQNDTGGTGSSPSLGLSRLPHDTGTDLLDMVDPAVLGYRLRTSLGPIFEPDPVVVPQSLATEFGTVSFSGVESFTFQATLVPEPAGLSLFPIAALVLRRRR